MTHTLGDTEHGGRHRIATDAEMGDLLAHIGERIERIEGDLHGQMDTVMRYLSPDTFPMIVSLPANTARDIAVGTAGTAILQKITLVKILPGAFPSSVSFRHDDMPGVFVLDSAQPTIEIDLTQHGIKTFHATNNDAAIDCAVILAYKRIE